MCFKLLLNSEKLLQICAKPEMHDTAAEVVRTVTEVNAEAADFDARAERKTGKAAVVLNRQFLFAQVVVAKTQLEYLVASEQKFAIKNEVSEEVVHAVTALIGRLVAAKHKHVVVLKVGVVVGDFPFLQVVRGDAETEQIGRAHV